MNVEELSRLIDESAPLAVDPDGTLHPAGTAAQVPGVALTTIRPQVWS